MIRPATEADIPVLLLMGAKFHHEAGWAEFAAFDTPSFEASLTNWIDNEAFRFFVWDDAGPRGFICGVLVPLYFNASVAVAHELLWWVEPSFRSGVGGNLLAAFHTGADLGFQTVSETTPRNAAVQRKLTMGGWRPVERNFIKRLG